MNQVTADGYKEVVDLNNNSDGLGKVEFISNVAMEAGSVVEEESDLDLATSEEEESISDLEEVEEFFDSKDAAFSVPLSIFHYKDYNSDFFTSWYNISSEILREINRACPEKKVLNLALSVLMLPYIAFTALGLVVCSRFKANGKKQEGVGEDKTEKSETGVPKRLAYGALAAIAIFVNVTVLVALIVPATVALATFYLLNRDLSHSLVAALKISMGQYSNKHQNIEVSFCEKEVSEPNIAWDMEVKFPPQFKRLLRDLCENNKWFDVTRDSEHSIVLKLSTNINLKNGLKPLHNEIKDVLATSIQEFAKTMEELMKLEKKDITYDKLKELLDEFRLKVVSSIDSKLTTHLIENAYQVAFIQAIKFAQKRRKDFSLEDALRDILVKQELESQGKELPTEREMIIKDLKSVGIKVRENSKDDEFSAYKADWKKLIEKGEVVGRTIIDSYKSVYPEETTEALRKVEEMIKELERMGEERYGKIHEELKELYENRENSNLEDDILKRKLEGLFKFEYDVEQKLIESRIRTIQAILSESDNEIKQSLAGDRNELNKIQTPDKVNEFITKMYLEIKKYKVQRLLNEQKEGVLDLCGILKRYNESGLAEIIEAFRMQDEGHFEESILEQTLKDQNERLQAKQKDGEKDHPIVKSIEVLLKRNEEILKALEQLELEKEGLLINEKTINDYREELESREKIKFAIIEDDLLKAFEHETFSEEAVKKLLEKAELEYYLAEKCIKSPVIKMKDNIKHFCQGLLSPLIDRLANLIINNVPKDNESGLWKIWNSLKVGFNYNVIGWSATVNKDNSTEGKALNVVHDTYKEGETFLQHLHSSYEEVGAFLGNLFSDDGEAFKNDVWPKVEEHLHGMWDRFFKDIEFKIGNKLDEVNVTQQNQGTVITV